jgi:hypothetical protein
MTLHPDLERLALLGWCLYPASNRSRAGCFKGATDASTHDLDRLEQWARAYPACNWRVVCGKSGIWGLDCDVPPGHAHDGIANLAALCNVHGPLPPRPQLRSGGGGVVLFFRHQGERIIGEAGHPAAGIDPRRGRQSQTIPPSVHLTTRRPYRWLVAPWEVAPPPAPEWLLRLLAPPPEPAIPKVQIDTSDAARRRLYRAALAVSQAVNGQRNAILNRRAFQIGRLIGAGLLDEREAVGALYGAARQVGLDHAETKATIRSGLMAGMRHGR